MTPTFALTRDGKRLQRRIPGIARRSSKTPVMADLATEGLVAALDQLASPAFVADARGRPAFANVLGTEMFARDPSGITENLRERISRQAPNVREIRASGLRPHWLVVIPTAATTPAERVDAASRAWGLTPRQVEVLRLVAMGDANKSIAARLGCAEVTVEFHMTALLRKASVENRAQLLTRFWTM